MKKKLIDEIESFFENYNDIFGNSILIEKIQKEESNSKNIKEKNKNLEKEIILSDVSKDLFTEEPEWKRTVNLFDLNEKIKNCLKCPLGYTRKNFVFGSGNPDASLMIIGEAPGADEDEQGLPFVGKAGQLLTKILEAINLKREEVYIANILKCRPPENRKPLESETDECEPYLMKQIELIKPKIILVLGLTAADTLLKSKNKMGEIRGKIMNFHGIKLLVTYHPAALLRNPNLKKDTWEDVKLLRKLYDES